MTSHLSYLSFMDSESPERDCPPLRRRKLRHGLMKPIRAPSASVHTVGRQVYCSNCDLVEVEDGSTRFADCFERLSPKSVSPARFVGRRIFKVACCMKSSALLNVCSVCGDLSSLPSFASIWMHTLEAFTGVI